MEFQGQGVDADKFLYTLQNGFTENLSSISPLNLSQSDQGAIVSYCR